MTSIHDLAAAVADNAELLEQRHAEREAAEEAFRLAKSRENNADVALSNARDALNKALDQA